MTAVCDEPRTAPAAWRLVAAAVVASLLIVAHGCHGDDVDHELSPAVAPPEHATEAR
ncbi:MAG: hypothetical protein U0746_14585 [Gemmataceae bacterium]